ncbi:ATP-binding response regulator [Bythopirellula goksoeyrii]|uniref:histidine kinase n=1 Tax=Bythopirellula goksoeyrii TaxID=1400387 RepID=A0A5B9QHN4_9BACT|nr:ATP-binding protein [Bythopirellula goksoeyrii]QEG33633.1 Autoinducer 2 sensor kinase/phosphatase LuxQ [Bythopirellula goksoeyrii]
MENQCRACLTRYGFAVLATVVATWARMSMHGWLDDHMPFGIYFLSAMLTVWVAGVGPAILSLFSGIAAGVYWVIEPRYSWTVTEPADQFSLAIYAVVGTAAIAIYWRADSRQVAVNLQSAANAELTEQLRAADRKKDNWLALLAHELRNPLAPIRSGIDLLDRETLKSEQVREIRKTMRRQTEQLLRIVEDLLDVSRYTRGQLRLECETVDLREIVKEAIEMVAPMIAENNHDLKEVKYCQPLVVNGDPTRLIQVVSNLLCNAAKYTPRGGRIQVLLDGDSDSARVCVIDNGIGITKELQSSVFDLFAQADSPRNRDRQGLGIGLALVKSLMDMHSGQVALHSDGPGKGSHFTITLPRQDSAMLVKVEPPESTPEVADSASIEGATVLLIDDNQEAVHTLEALLSLDGCRTYAAFDGPSGLEAMTVVQPDFVLLDIGMPGMDGYEVVRRIRKEAALPRPIVIAISGWGSEEDRQRALRAGFDDHLAKPVDYGELVDLLLAKASKCDAMESIAEGRKPQDLLRDKGFQPVK